MSNFNSYEDDDPRDDLFNEDDFYEDNDGWFEFEDLPTSVPIPKAKKDADEIGKKKSKKNRRNNARAREFKEYRIPKNYTDTDYDDS